MELLKKYPIKVMIFKRYGNALKPTMDSGRYAKEKITTADGYLENAYFKLKKDNIKIPIPDINFYQDIDGVRYIYFLQTDRFSYYPISFNADEMIVNFRSYDLERNDDGTPKLSETGEQILKREKIPFYERDAKGKIKNDDNGNPIILRYDMGDPLIVWDQRPLLNASYVNENGQAVKLPSMGANKTYDKEYWLSNQIETAQRLYRSKNFWEKYGNIITLAIAGIIIVMMLYTGAKEYAKLTQTMTDALIKVSENMNILSDNVRASVGALKSVPAVVPPV